MTKCRESTLLRFLLVPALLLVFLIGADAPDSTGAKPVGLGKRINLFTFDFLKKLAESDTGNTIVSPHSIFRGLAMSYLASGGETQAELARAAYFPDDGRQLLVDLQDLGARIDSAAKTGKIDLRMANSAWLDSTYATFRKEFTQDLSSFGASLNAIRFRNAGAASKQINQWIAKQTNGKIKEGIAPADLASRSGPNTIDEPALVTVDTLYYKADWGSKFKGSETEKRDFTLSSGETVQTPMMHQKSLLTYGENASFKYLELPYKGRGFTMQVLLPKKNLSIQEQLALVDGNTMAELRKTRARYNVDVLFPKFAFSDRCNVKSVLSGLGVHAAFKKTANFDRMIIKTREANWIYLSGMRHDAWIEVDEKGTKAAAATTTRHFSFGCGAPRTYPRTDFHADRPFLFFVVHEESQSILFAGWIANPKGAE